MPVKRNRGNQKDSDKNRRGNVNRGRSSPSRSHDTDENLHKRYEGYDEKRTSLNPDYEKNFDVDEKDINQRIEKYEDLKKD